MGSLCAQGEANIWYFGTNAGLNFNGGAPVALTNGQLNSFEGCASISNAAGNLLFYTNGVTVWNSNHVQMFNGFGLLGNLSTTQSAVIIQKPSSATIYYIFTADATAGTNGIRYSEVDMALNAGLGAVTGTKNILLNTPSCEKIAGIRHCNNKDVWVVTHDWNSDAFRTYLVTAAGVNTTPVISNLGLVVGTNTGNTLGQLKGSPDGGKLASAIWDPINRFELFDFDNSTGIVSNAILFPQFVTTSGAYGVEFSPDGTKMYGSVITPGNIYQFNLCAGSNAAIASSGVLVGTSPTNFNGSLQLGPDKKIYVAKDNTSSLGVINNPNVLGVGCSYVDIGITLAGKNSTIGLPNFVNYYFKEPPPPFTSSINCLDGTFTTPTVNISNCSGSTNAITSVSWNFGDPASGGSNTSTSNNPSHTFTGPGTYTITLVLGYACGTDTIQQSVTPVSCGFTASATSTSVACNGQCTGTASATVSAGTGPYTYFWNTTLIETTQQVTGLCPGSYTVTATDALGATSTATVSITEPTSLSATTNSSAASCGSNNGSATVTASGGTSGYTYSWNASPVQTTQTATGLAAGNYTAIVTDANGCSITETVTVDSVVTSILTNQSTSICSGSTYTLPGGTIVNTAGTYYDTLTSANGCDSIIATTLIVNPVLLSNHSPAICSGSTYALPGGTVVNASGIYMDTLTSSNGCDSIITTNLTVNPSPTAAAFSDTSILQGESITLTASGGGTYSWSNGANGDSISVTPLATTIYCVTVTNASNCTDIACVTVSAELIDCSNKGQLFIPNAFSPNADGDNDLLQIYYGDMRCIESIKLVIYNRWGEKVFESIDPDFSWDGKQRGQLLNTQVLVYHLRADFQDQTKVEKRGNISLVR